jgi:quercetin dioxygenase-like cupin family protein
MRPIAPAFLLLTISTAACRTSPTAANAASQPELTWGPAPAVFPPGAQMAVVQGNPGGADLFTVRLRLPDGYRLPPHTHPTDEHVTVISGTFRVGMGSVLDVAKTTALTAGGFVSAPANHAHFGVAQGATVVQVHALGPFALTYVNAADAAQAAARR